MIHRRTETLALFQPHSPSSRAAAVHVAPSADTMRAAVLRVIRESPDGLTDIEIQERLHMNGSTQRPRRVELVERGLVRDSGRKRRSASGVACVVWEPTQEPRP